MAGTQYRGVTAKNRRLSQRSRTLWRPMFLKHRLPKKLAGIERALELPNRRSRIFPKTKPQRSIPQTRHRPASYPLHHTRQTVVVRLRRDSFYRSLLAILLRRLAESVISGKAPSPSITLKQPIIKNKRPSEIVSDGLSAIKNRQNILPVLCSYPTVKQALPLILGRRHRYPIRYRATIRSRWFSHGFARPRV